MTIKKEGGGTSREGQGSVKEGSVSRSVLKLWHAAAGTDQARSQIHVE